MSATPAPEVNIGQQILGLLQDLNQRFDKMDEDLEKIYGRLDLLQAFNERFDKMDEEIKALKKVRPGLPPPRRPPLPSRDTRRPL